MATRELAEFAAAISYEKIPAATIRKTKQCILDWLGVCIRGSQEKPVKMIRNVLLEAGGAKQASIIAGSREETSALQAAFCNGAASHSLDFDDLHNPSIIHLATVVIPPVFAIGEAEHKSGRDMLAAVVAGLAACGFAGAALGAGVGTCLGTAGSGGCAAAGGFFLPDLPFSHSALLISADISAS